jgi:hypothetical protein
MTFLATILGGLLMLVIGLGTAFATLGFALLRSGLTLLGCAARAFHRRNQRESNDQPTQRKLTDLDDDGELGPCITVENGIAVAHHRDEDRVVFRAAQRGLCRDPLGRVATAPRRRRAALRS